MAVHAYGDVVGMGWGLSVIFSTVIHGLGGFLPLRARKPASIVVWLKLSMRVWDAARGRVCAFLSWMGRLGRGEPGLGSMLPRFPSVLGNGALLWAGLLEPPL